MPLISTLWFCFHLCVNGYMCRCRVYTCKDNQRKQGHEFETDRKVAGGERIQWKALDERKGKEEWHNYDFKNKIFIIIKSIAWRTPLSLCVVLTDLFFCRSCVYKHSCCEFMSEWPCHVQKLSFSTIIPDLWLLKSFLPLFYNILSLGQGSYVSYIPHSGLSPPQSLLLCTLTSLSLCD